MASNEVPAWYASAAEFACTPNSQREVMSGSVMRPSAEPGPTTASFRSKAGVREPGVFRQVMESLACLAVAVIVFRAFLLEGYIISTGSMAPSLLGYHKQVVCPDCQFEFAFGVAFDRAGPAVSSQLATCPNCGQGAIDVSSVPRNDGDQLLVSKHAYLFQDPERWDVVVFLNPNNASQAYVKRVAGLPGETIFVRDGDVYINGRIQQKSLSQQRAIRIPVYDQRFQATQPDWIPRWLTDSGWSGRGDTFVFDQKPDLRKERLTFNVHALSREPDRHSDTAWVRYFHWPRLRPMRARSGTHSETLRPSPITDSYGYNQPTRVSERYRVHDLMLAARLSFKASDESESSLAAGTTESLPTTEGEFAARLRCRSKQAVCRISSESRTLDLWIVGSSEREADRVLNDGVRADVTVPLRPEWFQSDLEFELSTFDRQVLIAINGVELAVVPLERDYQEVPDRTWSESLDGEQSEMTVAGYLADSTLRAAESPSTVDRHQIRQSVWKRDGRSETTGSSTSDSADGLDSESQLSPVGFGARHGRVSVESVVLYRDVHYTTENHRHATERPLTLGDDEFFFLGDNSPVSLDSRGWVDPVVPRRLLVGRPLVVHLPSHPGRIRIGSTVKYIRVPDFSRIRAIR